MAKTGFIIAQFTLARGTTIFKQYATKIKTFI